MRRSAIDITRLVRTSIERAKKRPHAIFADHDLPRMVDEGIEILREDTALYYRAGELVRVKPVGSPKKRDRVKREMGTLVIERYPAPAMREYLIASTYFF